MAFVTANNEPVVRADIALPRVGVWVADLVVDSQAAIEGPVTIELASGKVRLQGTALRSGTHRDAAQLRVVGGANGLSKEVPAKFYRGVPASIAVEDVLKEAGETLSPEHHRDLLGKLLPAWTRLKGPASEALLALVDEVGASWRILADGTLWIGRETFPVFELEHQLLAEDPSAGTVEIGSEVPSLIPGVTFRDRRVSRVEHLIDAASTRTLVSFETQGGDGDRLRAALAAIVRSQTAHVDFHALYPARVVAQNSDETLELQPDDSRLPGMSKVPIRYGVPGVSSKIAVGARILLGFDSGDPAKPVATVWESASVQELVLRASTKLQLGGPTAVQQVVLGNAYRTAEDAMLGLMSSEASATAATIAAIAAAFAAMAADATLIATPATKTAMGAVAAPAIASAAAGATAVAGISTFTGGATGYLSGVTKTV